MEHKRDQRSSGVGNVGTALEHEKQTREAEMADDGGPASLHIKVS